MTSVIGEKIIKFSGEAEGDHQINFRTIINDIADNSITIRKYQLRTFFNRNFRIPDFQRGYEWGEEQWEELWQEIEALFDADDSVVETSVQDVFFGSMFFAESEETDQDEGATDDLVYDIIDGQQRVTTLTILFKILADKIQESLEADASLIRELSAETGNIRELIYEDTSAGAEEKPSLTLNRHNREFFEALMTNQDAQLRYLLSADRLHGNTKENAIRVREYLDKFEIDHEKYLMAVNDPGYYSQFEDTSRRPNLLSSQINELQRLIEESENGEEPVLDPNQGLGKELLDNKVEVNDENQELLDAYDYFNQLVNEELQRYDSARKRAYALVNVKNYIVYMFRVGYFEVKRDQPRLLMKIFEILNDRGIELKKADVMRTRIVARFRNEDSEKEYVDKWEKVVSEFGSDEIVEFLRTYFVVQGGAKSRGELKNNLLEAFVRDPNDGEDRKLDSQLSSVEKAEVFIDNLVEYAPYYHDIIDPLNRGFDLGDEGDSDIQEECTRIISRLDKAGTSIWEPLVLAFYRDTMEEEIGNQTQLLQLLRAVESISIRKFAVMDTHTRDRAYANAIGEYHNNGINGDVVENLLNIETDDPNAVGERFVEALLQADWRKQWGKQVLRKLVSENFAGDDDQIVLRQLNQNDNLVHLEHVFPLTPKRNSEEPYEWYKHFFRTAQESELGSLVEEFINQEADEILEDIAEHYQRDLGNLLLLRSKENIKTGNSLFDRKAIDYLQTDGFSELHSSQYIWSNVLQGHIREDLERYGKLEDILNMEEEELEEKWDVISDNVRIEAGSSTELIDKIREEIGSLEGQISSLSSEWNYQEVTKNRAYLVKELCESIKISDDEFDEVNFQELSAEVTETKNDIITANFRRRA